MEADVDLSKFKTSDWLKVGGAVAVLIGYFLDWTNVPGAGDFNLSGSDFFFRGTLPWLLVLAVGILTFLMASGTMKGGSLPWPLIFLAATGLATLLVLIYIIHPSYSGVTYGLLHGSLPHAQVMCAQPSRTAINRSDWIPIPPLVDFIRLSENAAAPLRPAPVIGVSLNTYDLDEDAAHRAVETVRRETGLPTTDTVRFGPAILADAIASFHQTRPR